ncbi:MAG: Gp15 family bacteriophage protein [Oscillospiraceae bacterium]|nr:Gp15 family bacteriophage protein [Oscillospiraceae bacterium]
MISFADTAPPENVTVNGTEYAVNYDFRVWADISGLIREFAYNSSDEGDQLNNFELIAQIEQLAFGRIINEPWQNVFDSIVKFLCGYPHEDNGYKQQEDDSRKLYSFKHDMAYIILAIRNQSGIDLSYRRKEPFHWWLFLLEFQSLEERHYICSLMRRRAYDGNDRELCKLRDSVALPPEYSRSEKAAIQQLINDFGG